jgi:hypothetical protein
MRGKSTAMDSQNLDHKSSHKKNTIFQVGETRKVDFTTERFSDQGSQRSNM